ncbi:hypothetical protein PIB30_075334, partial [Stylosanthes scabra]|nr:hypothetical protein [Stylosanthes scabra]
MAIPRRMLGRAFNQMMFRRTITGSNFPHRSPLLISNSTHSDGLLLRCHFRYPTTLTGKN